jgi:hypothetical protein
VEQPVLDCRAVTLAGGDDDVPVLVDAPDIQFRTAGESGILDLAVELRLTDGGAVPVDDPSMSSARVARIRGWSLVRKPSKYCATTSRWVAPAMVLAVPVTRFSSIISSASICAY